MRESKMTGRVAALLLVLAAGLSGAGPAAAETPVGTRVYVETWRAPSAEELKAARRYGRDLFARAEAAGRPVTLRVARSEATVMISFESVAICDRVRACPLMVFRDLKSRPVYQGGAFENIRLDYRKDGTWLILRVWDDVTECKLTGVTRARCRPLVEDGN